MTWGSAKLLKICQEWPERNKNNKTYYNSFRQKIMECITNPVNVGEDIVNKLWYKTSSGQE